MLRTRSRFALTTIAMTMLLALAGIAAACGDDVTTPTASTSSSVSASPSTDGTAAAGKAGDGATTSGDQRVVVGGQEKEEYSAQIPELQQALESDPDNFDTLQQLAVAQYNTEAYEDAAATYEKMLSIEDTAFSRNNYANVLRDWEKTDEAIANYEKAISMDSTLVTPYINLASVLARRGEIQEAITILEGSLDSITPADGERVKTYLEQLRAVE